MIRVTRRYRFAASHRLHCAQLSEPANQELYGKCNNPYGHGHNYTLEVSVRGPIDPRTGCAVDLRALDALVAREVLAAFDHKNLNAEIPAFAAQVPTAENLAREIEKRLAVKLPALEKVRVRETRKNSVELSL